MQIIDIKIINTSQHPLPAYATALASGVDLYANFTETATITIAPFERALIPTGIFIEIPEGYEAQIRPRSGLALKNGLTCLNTPGTIDADYRGEIKVILANLSQTPFEITNGMRIAQMVFAPVVQARFVETVAINETQRGAGGFGSTGTK